MSERARAGCAAILALALVWGALTPVGPAIEAVLVTTPSPLADGNNTTSPPPPPEAFAFAQLCGASLVVVVPVVAYLMWKRKQPPRAFAIGACPRCGAPLPPGANFCGTCGTPVAVHPPPGRLPQ